MNYITEINKFYDWLETNPISDSSIVLWHALMHINNKCGWRPQFAVAISSIQNKTGLSKSSILRARNILQQNGRINFISRTGQQSAFYSVIAFQTDTQSGTQTGTQTVTQSGTQTVPITKLNKTKQNKTREIGNPDKPAPTSSNFVKPSVLELETFFSKKNLEKKLEWPPAKIQEKAEKFFNFYESKGWMIGKNKMRDWQAAVCGQWLKDKFSNYGTNQAKPAGAKAGTVKNFDNVDYSKF